jgi:hypothetical protein
MLSPLSLKIQGLIFFIFIFLVPDSSNSLSAGSPLPAGRIIVIDKAKKSLILFMDGGQQLEFPATFGIDPDSDKYKAYDCATPEGLYFITDKNTSSRFHRLLAISYPNFANAQKGLAEGVISLMEYKRIYKALRKSKRSTGDTGLGSGIAIHGGGVFRLVGKTRERDWTEGCIALNDNDMETVFNFCRLGDPVVIFNSRRSLYGIIRPFTHIKESNEKGVPICPEAICTYQVEIATLLGQVVIVVKEGKDYGRSMQVMVYNVDDREEPLLALVDRNADGDLSSMDGSSGPILDENTPEAAYEMVREAVIAALATGGIADSGGGR